MISAIHRDIFLVVAMAENRMIGADGRLPWHIPADLKRFKALTIGHPMIMGRKTFESLPAPLPHRRHIVLTRDRSWHAEAAEIAGSWDEAMALAGSGDVAVVGGGEIYRLALPHASRIELTEVHAEITGDVTMPVLDEGWHELFREEHQPANGRPAFGFVTLRRRGS